MKRYSLLSVERYSLFSICNFISLLFVAIIYIVPWRVANYQIVTDISRYVI